MHEIGAAGEMQASVRCSLFISIDFSGAAPKEERIISFSKLSWSQLITDY